jgi:hypothetical protein
LVGSIERNEGHAMFIVGPGKRKQMLQVSGNLAGEHGYSAKDVVESVMLLMESKVASMNDADLDDKEKVKEIRHLAQSLKTKKLKEPPQ